VLCQVWRFDRKDQDGQPALNEHGKPEKEFAVLTFCRNTTTQKTAWRWKGLPAPRPLYHLDQLAANPHATVIFCEGEKAADAGQKLFPDWVSTTTLNGAQSPHKAEFSPLASRTVGVWADNDEAGRKYAGRVAALLQGIAKEVKFLHIPGDHPEGWDAYDALLEGWRPEQGYALEAADPLEQAKAILQELDNKDPGAWFEESVLETLALLYKESKPDYERAILQARKAKASLKDLKEEVKRCARTLKNSTGGNPTHPLKPQPVSGLAEEFKVNDRGVWYHPPHDPLEDPKPPVRICAPLAVTAYTRNDEGEAWGRLLEFKDLEGRRHTWALPMRLLHTERSEYRAVLAELGLEIA
jgi:putative DNA primase/helicase